MAYGSKMEDILRQLAKDIITPKFANIKYTANVAIEILEDEEKLKVIEAWELREICLQPLQLALESRARKLGHTALAGIQTMFKDERFRSSMETSDEDKWMPSQVLTVLAVAHSLAEDLQIEIMKLLLNMTVTASWCTSAKTIIKIAQAVLVLHSVKSCRDHARICLLSILALYSRSHCNIDPDVDLWLTQLFLYNNVYMGSYQNCVMVQGAVQAAFITMINKFVGGLMEQAVVEDGDDVLADFKSDIRSVSRENLTNEVVLILTFLTDRLEVVSSSSQGKQTLPLLLEGVNIILSKVSHTIKSNEDFQELLWKRLCPSLISLLGEPKAEKVAGLPQATKQSGTCTASPHITQGSAKIIYNIAGELACLVGSVPQLRAVLEALFHKILMFPLPQSRNDALRVLKELMSEPHKVISLIGAGVLSSKDKNLDANMALIKMLIESIYQSSHCQDPAVVYTSVSCIDALLASLDRIRQGEAIPDSLLKPHKGTRSHSRRSMTSNPDDDGGSDLTTDHFDESEDSSSEPEDTVLNKEVVSLDQQTDTGVKPVTSPSMTEFEVHERENAQQFVAFLRQMLPAVQSSVSVFEVDEALQDIAAQFCSSIQGNSSHRDKFSSSVVLNSDGIYVAAIVVLKLNLQLLKSGYYQNKRHLTVTEKDFVNEIFSSGLLLYLPPAWLKEVFAQVVSSSLLDGTISDTGNYLISLLQDLEGIGTTEERGRLMSSFRVDPELPAGDDINRMQRIEAGKLLSINVLSTCWQQILDILSVMLNEQVSSSGGGTRYSLALLLATDSAQEDVRKARSAICMSLNGLQRAAKLCCVLGLQQLCGSAFSQLAATSCVKEDFRALAGADNKTQSKTVLSSHKPKLVKLHAAHVLSMDVVMTTGLEVGSHSADCWKHVFRCCAHISELEHTYFSQGNNQSSLPKITHGALAKDGAEADGSCETDMYSGHIAPAVPVAPRINVPALIQQSGLESGWDNSLAAGGVLTFSQASKALCGLSQEVDSLFEDAADKLCLDALLSFLRELGEATVVQQQRLGGERASSRPPTNALHLYRLQQVLVRVVNSSRPLLHLLRVWSVVSPYLVQATGNPDHVISKMAVTSIHEFIVSLVSQREEKAYFHVNEYVCKTFEDMLCLELCDGDVQDQIVCCICELVEACSSQLQSGWRPLFGALRSVKIEYTTSEAVNEARQRHVAAVMDVFNVYLSMDNVTVFANATVDCILCLLKYVHGPATFDSDFSDDRSESGSDDEYGSAEGELENLCVPALKYLTQVCQILTSMWQMPACPIFKGAHRIQTDSACRTVDHEIPFMNFKQFADEFLCTPTSVCNTADVQAGLKDESLPVKGEQVQSGVAGVEGRDVSCPDNSGTDVHRPDNSGTDVQRPDNSGTDVQQAEGQDTPVTSSQVLDADADRPSGCPREETQVESSQVQACEGAKESASTRPATLSGLSACHETQGWGDNFTAYDVSSTQSTTHLGSYRSLDDMDSKSGVLHVWFLLLDGLVSAINHCPKSSQSHALGTLIDLLKLAAHVPGPEFAMYCVNHQLLPMLQSWLRRGSRCYGYWNTAIISFKQCCGLVADLVVEFLKKFSSEPSVEDPLQLMLKQTFDVFKECVAQPVENISRLGCSCIRHVLLSAGASMSEQLWQVSAIAVRQALSVTTYNLQLLMALFHPNSDNFYGDIGQVKVATRKDCTVVDCLRLRQMARQVFLLDSQVSSMPDVQYDTDQDKSFVFLLYPPGHQDSLNPDHITTRVPFRHVIVGLLSNQLLLQTVGSILLDKNQKLDQESSLPGLMEHMSTRNIHQFLSALHDVFIVAQEFDARPGLKFLLQKVACLDVAANLYKQAASAMLFHVHSLVEICASLDNSSITSTQVAITPVSESPDTPGVLPSMCQLNQQASLSLAKPLSSGKIFLPLLQITCEELCQSYMEVLSHAGKGSLLDKMAEKPIFFLTVQHDDIAQIASQVHSLAAASKEPSKFLKSQPKPFESGAVKPVNFDVSTPQIEQDSELESNTDDDTHSEISKESDVIREEEEDESRMKSKREIREELESKVYTVATDQVIETLMHQYKRHKHQRSMPNFVRLPKFQRSRLQVQRKVAVDENIEKQQKSSIMKDSEAHIQAWSDMLTAVLQMIMNLNDHCFSSLLPVTFTMVSHLILNASDAALREQLAQCFNRLGKLYNFAPVKSP
ncbi:brefeldin A-inhibited guanine nucleotide-exchange protein 3-like isoform X2 [Physella acuta]|uniref:brefeldin A-inhibited guanine nucleotide-exchange protein 3-like isoform X2 n=1 Tax=Physella acuta TaxID=109671 RepID=UPI0027DAD446|nr:brefeldin A-inhibited guanine nucleotide-exchange protein 3-like isoform X2 [Physella acuta]